MTEKTADFSGHGFLIADDKAFMRDMIHGMLVRCQARTIEHASNGAEAMKGLSQNPETIDCILCDWNMAPADGLDVLRSIRSGRVHNTPRDLRVIMLTGHADEQVVKTALAMDANGYVVKPVSIAKLVHAIEHAFAKPMTLKPATAYESVGLADAPDGAFQPSEKRTSPWVVWPGPREEERRSWARRLEQIRREASAKVERLIEKKRSVVNRQRQDIADIPAGKILAEDIFAEEGQLLLAFGTPLTESLLGRLRDLAAYSVVKAQLLVGDFED